MHSTLTQQDFETIASALRIANAAFSKIYPGDSSKRQPVHTVYGGAQIFKADTATKLGSTALKSLIENAPNFSAFARGIGLPGNERLPKSTTQIKSIEKKLKKNPDAVRRTNEHAWLAYTIYERVIEKLKREPVEDFRIDFEDGYGNRPDAEEDGHAASAALEVVRGMNEHLLPPFIGIRIKPFAEELKTRSIRTLDIFITTLLKNSDGKLPDNFVVTLPKVVIPEQVTALVELLKILETKNSLRSGSLRLEIMIETPQSIFNSNGQISMPAFVAASEGRCVAAHFGVYDYTAANNITAAFQSMIHPACDFARTVMKVSLAGTGIWISDGATNVMPVGPHRAEKGKKLSPRQQEENREVVHRVWKLNFEHINHSLMNGYYQGWDLHPAQLPVRYAAVYAFFIQGLESASARLKTFVEKAAQATLIGDVFDDAATGQGLLNFFLQGIGCGAITEEEALATGLTLEEIRSRSFVKILQNRRK
ncbi:MAG: phosphoenolpyruvate kinase [Bacteroidota bacterium]